MFDLVADIESYPEFLPWCKALRITKGDFDGNEGALTAEMVVAYKVFREKFKSEVQLSRKSGIIDVRYVNGPFKSLENVWRFTDSTDGNSVVDFDIAFEFSNLFLQTTAHSVFDKAFTRMSDAFVNRADTVYR